MRPIFLVALFALLSSGAQAQYTKESISAIVTGGSSKSWIDNGTSTVYTFSSNMKGEIKKATGSAQPVSWNLNTPDNLTWNLIISKESYELIISYNKEGTQYLKLVRYTGGNRVAGYKEIKLFPKT